MPKKLAPAPAPEPSPAPSPSPGDLGGQLGFEIHRLLARVGREFGAQQVLALRSVEHVLQRLVGQDREIEDDGGGNRGGRKFPVRGPEPDHDREMDRQGDREAEQQQMHPTLPEEPTSLLDQITDPFGEMHRIHVRIGVRTGRRRGIGVGFSHPWSHS